MIVITGSLAYDFIMDFPGRFSEQIVPDKIHLINISFLVNSLVKRKGGTAGNIAFNLALLEQKTAVLSSVGKDFSSYKKFLEKNKVETKYINIVKNDYTARAFITTDLADNQIAGFYPGALTQDKKLSFPSNLSSNDFIVIAPTDPKAMDNFVSMCVKKNIAFMFDPGMQLPRLSISTLKKGIEHAKIVIGNDYEMAMIFKKLKAAQARLGGKNMLKAALPRLSHLHSEEQIWITTLGDKGSCIDYSNNRSVKKIKIQPADPKKIVDPTGAGDAYRAGFLSGFLSGLPLKTCGQMGSTAASFAIEKYGTIEHSFTVSKFKKRYKENFGKLKGFK